MIPLTIHIRGRAPFRSFFHRDSAPAVAAALVEHLPTIAQAAGRASATVEINDVTHLIMVAHRKEET